MFFFLRKDKKIKVDRDRQIRRAARMYEFGYSNAEIADIMEIKEAEVRDLLKKEEKAA